MPKANERDPLEGMAFELFKAMVAGDAALDSLARIADEKLPRRNISEMAYAAFEAAKAFQFEADERSEIYAKCWKPGDTEAAIDRYRSARHPVQSKTVKGIKKRHAKEIRPYPIQNIISVSGRI